MLTSRKYRACRNLLLGFAVALTLPVLAKSPSTSADLVIPTVYESGHFYAVPALANGKRMRLLLDTGGGGYPTLFIPQSQADALDLKTDHTCEMRGTVIHVTTPTYAAGQALPDLSASCRGVIIAPNRKGGTREGQINPAYFMGGVWTFDYPGQRVVLRGTGWRPPKSVHKTALGFKHLTHGKSAGWPRLTVRVDGEELDMLLDTGATAQPTAEALNVDPGSTANRIGVASYIVQSTMNRWRKRHPQWKVLENGDALYTGYPRMIRVPDVEIAGWHVGPVWFIERPDQEFQGMMTQLMDKTPDGAVGGNVFDAFQMTLDYKHKEAWFQCETGCPASAVQNPQKDDQIDTLKTRAFASRPL